MNITYTDHPPVISAGQRRENDLIGKSVAGYQAWFKTHGAIHADGSPSAPDGELPTEDTGWHHWSGKTKPAPGHLSFEVYPDVSEYPEDTMAETGLGPMPDGSPSRLFHSRDPEVIDLHFDWMARCGIDGAAVQRFYGDAKSTDLDTGAPHLGWIRDAAEWHQRIFYIMYDVSGARAHGDEVIYTLQQDIVRNLESRDIINSPAYAHANNRPVICIWGLNGAPQSRYPAETVLLPFIRWLKRRGYFVIGGSCDDNWRSDNSCFTAVYNAVDMLSPWTVGRYNPDTVETFFIKEGRLQAERDWCAARGIFYQPVLFPGFSWCNWNNNAVNHIPRASGRFLWQQARLYAAAGIKNLYFAMYDEYDEGTALMKAATDSRMIPAGPQYFQTLAADGQWLSADYYLRLAGRITALLKQNAPFKKYPDIPYSKGPVYWYNGFERRTAYVRTARKAAAYPVEANIDVCLYNPEWLERKKAHELVAAVVKGGDYAHSGEYGFAFSGFCAADGLLCYKIADTRIKSGKPLHLLYALKPGNEGGLKVRVDLLFDDGSRLSERVAAPTFSGEIGEWQQLSCPIKPTGRTVTAVLVTAEGVGGDFAACIDDIEIVET